MSGVILEPIEPETDGDDREEVALGGAPRSGRWRPVLVAGAAVVLVASIALVGRNGGGAAAPPTTTAPSTTAAPTTTSRAPRRPARPNFTQDQMSMSFLDAPSGTSLYGVSSDGNVVRIDLDAGMVTQRRLRRADRAQAPATIFARGGGAVVAAQNQALTVGDGAGGDVAFLASDTTTVLPAADPNEVWLGDTIDAGRRTAQRRVVPDGQATGTVAELPAGDILGDDGSGALLVQTPSGVYRADDSGGPPQPVSVDPLVAWSASALVTERCDEQRACQWECVDRATGEHHPIGAAPWAGSVLASALSPDGGHLAYVGGIGGPTSPAVEVMDVATGARTVLDHGAALTATDGAWSGLVWSADGQWLFWVSEIGSLRAWHVGAPEPMVVNGAGFIPALRTIALAR